MTLARRREDQPSRTETPLGRLVWTLRYGSIDAMLILTGIGLIGWALSGMVMAYQDLIKFSLMHVFGTPTWWALTYIFFGVALIGIVACDWPRWSPFAGAGLTVVWSWTLLMRYANGATYQTGQVTTVFCMIIGFLIVQRSARR